MDRNIRYVPFKFSAKETEFAYKISVMDFLKYKNGYEVVKRTQEQKNDDGETDIVPVLFNGNQVLDVYKNGKKIEDLFLVDVSYPTDEGFYPAVDFLINYCGYTVMDAIAEVYLAVKGFPYNYTDRLVSKGAAQTEFITPEFISTIPDNELFDLCPDNITFKDWFNASSQKKYEWLCLYCDEKLAQLIDHRYKKTVSRMNHIPDPNKFIAPKSSLYASSVAAYLVNEYNITEDFIAFLISKHLLYEDTMGNMVAPGYDEKGHMVYAHVRSSFDSESESRSDSVSIIDDTVLDSDENYSWRYINPKSNRLYVFDDILSLFCYMNYMDYTVSTTDIALQDYKMYSFMFVGHITPAIGLPNNLFSFIRDNKNIREIYICFTNETVHGYNNGQIVSEKLIEALNEHFSKEHILIQNILPTEDGVDYPTFAALYKQKGK